MSAAHAETVVDFNIQPDTRRFSQGSASRNAIMAAAREEIRRSGWRDFDLQSALNHVKAPIAQIEEYWPSTACLVVDAVLDVLETPVISDHHPLNEQLARLIDPVVDMARSGSDAILMRSALLAAADEADANKLFRAHINDHFKRPLKQVLATARAKKEIRQLYDVDMAMELLFGPLWHRLIVLRAPFPESTSINAVTGLMDHLRG